MRTQIGIVGAGPAGLLLSHLLHLHNIASVVVETHSRKHCEERVRAGVLEQPTVDLLIRSGVGDRLTREGLVHHGIELLFKERRHRIDLHQLTGGRAITVYGQQEVVKDLIAARLAAAGPLFFEATDVSVHEIDSPSPSIRFRQAGEERAVTCDFIAGCDGFHGICRPSIPPSALACYERLYPFAWLGILAEVPPPSNELIYCNHERGFALLSMRSPVLTRLYLQCRPGEELSSWPDERIWGELRARFQTAGGFSLTAGHVVQKGITPMRGFVAEPMQYRRLFLAGDAAHIVPPTGAKGMNLAMADVYFLARAFAGYYHASRSDLLDRYSETCLRRVWRVQHFSYWMTTMLHRSEAAGGFEYRRQLAELDYLTTSRAAAQSLAENYTGWPLD